MQYGEGCQISSSNNITILSPAGPTTVTINPEISENELQVPEMSVSQLSNLHHKILQMDLAPHLFSLAI